MKRIKILLAVFTAVGIVIGPVVSAGAATAAAAAPSGWLRLPADLPADWQSLSPVELARYGILPNQGTALATHSTAATTPSRVRPLVTLDAISPCVSTSREPVWS